MSDQHSFVPADRFDRDQFTDPQAGERALNAAIVRAEISRSFEEYLEIFDAFYADDIEVSSDTGEQAIWGKAEVRSVLLNFLVPLHIMAEVSGLSVSIRQSSIPSDAAGETYSGWTLDLVGASGKTVTLSWSTFRTWRGAQVVHEHHYDHLQIGDPLSFDDLRFK